MKISAKSNTLGVKTEIALRRAEARFFEILPQLAGAVSFPCGPYFQASSVSFLERKGSKSVS